MSDNIVIEHLRAMRAENALHRNDVMVELGSLRREVSVLAERVATIETLIVRQQRELYQVIDRQATQH